MTNRPPDAPNARRNAYGSAVERLLDAAEMLVALEGEGVSSRRILQTAGQRNKSAIEYHFGNRRELFNAVWMRGTTVVNTRRDELLGGRPPSAATLPELVDSYVTPLAEYIDSRRPHSYWGRFVEESVQRYPLEIEPGLRETLAQYGIIIPLNELLDIFAAMQDHLAGDGGATPPRRRVSVLVRCVVSTLAAWERDAEAGRAPVGVMDLARELKVTGMNLLRP